MSRTTSILGIVFFGTLGLLTLIFGGVYFFFRELGKRNLDLCLSKLAVFLKRTYEQLYPVNLGPHGSVGRHTYGLYRSNVSWAPSAHPPSLTVGNSWPLLNI